MIKVFKKNTNQGWYEVVYLDTKTGDFKQILQDSDWGYPFGKPFVTTVFKLGHKSVTDYLKAKKVLLGDVVSFKEQQESEKQGLLKVLEYRKRMEIKYDDIVNVLKDYQ